ncbi:hypothetical protein GH714_022923 [Hevea brasiliensis]|uniref:BAT2 N-terminal domain-containing protein n=1 Tax=Hevea brasiliensis TaxID=3981 RepID=A0A6A6MG61_HEVBR|nr:hypothetical protein GH714_022923 [Hevea brasiliensis]
MTVLGKVAVPKPINLPSQRLENHGLDPNVEIVPKGTHSWGSRSSSSTSNAWVSSSLSLNTDGGTGSPSYLSGRPSSGGSGTRPSTAGSDRVNEPVSNAWGSNSRPSSSSGALPSNQTSHAAVRPRSAETRPGSSHLSRFAEPLSDNSVAWGAMGTSDKLGVTSSKNDGFSLTYGDFPTLSSEKDSSRKNADSQAGSISVYAQHTKSWFSWSSGLICGVASGKEGTGDSAGDGFVHTNVKTGAESPWRRENSLYGEDGARANVEKWHADHQPYSNSKDLRGPPFGSPVAPSGFPIEPFPYYRPQMPPPALAGRQPVPPPGAGPRGPHPKNGDMYRPHMHDAYMRPSMPLRPGFYPGPLPYEGYYGPPMGYCNPNERDVPLMGMAMVPAACSRYPCQNVPDPGNSHGIIGGYVHSNKEMVMDQVELVHSQDARGPYKVLLKQHDGWEGRVEGINNKKDDELDARRMALVEEASSEAVNNQGVVPMKVKSPESGGKLNASDDSLAKKIDDAASNIPEVASPKDSSLIQKIEGLNAKTRSSDGRQDVKPFSSRRSRRINYKSRAKMRELAKQLKQQEKEEEERTREQRAKALAKLEELNRRTQAGEVVTQKLENVPASALQYRQEEFLNFAHQLEKLETLPSSVVRNRHEESTAAGSPIVVPSKSRASSSALGSSRNMIAHGKNSNNTVDKSSSIASNVPLGTPKIQVNVSVVVHEQPKPFQPDSNNADAAHCSGTPRVHDSIASKQKHTGYRQKQSSPLERNCNETLVSSSGTEASQGIVANATISPESVADEIDSNCKSNLPSVEAESSVYHRRKNRNGKNKPKMEPASSAAALPSVVSKDTTTLDCSVESVKPKSSESMLDPSRVHSPTDSNDANHLCTSLTNEETHIRVNNQWRSQHPRKMMRNSQGNKPAEKNNIGDAVVWAPVRSQHKTEVSEEANQNGLVDSVVLSAKNDQQVQNNPRNKRAEMERYIPKPVAKELSQQGSTHQAVVPSSNQITSDETAERPESGSLVVESSQISGTATVMASHAIEARTVDVRQNKSGKVHGAWRLRGAAESTTSNLSRSFQKSIEDHQHQKPIGKRQPHKGHKGTGYNHNPDEKRTSADADKVYIQSAAAEMHQIDLSSASKENHSAVERSTSHWQPKSQPISATSQRGSRANTSVHGGSEGGMAIKKESNQRGESVLPQLDKDTAAVRPQSHHDQSLPENNNFEEAPGVGQQEPKREMKMAAHRGRPGSPIESSSSNMDVRHDQHMSSGFRKMEIKIAVLVETMNLVEIGVVPVKITDNIRYMQSGKDTEIIHIMSTIQLRPTTIAKRTWNQKMVLIIPVQGIESGAKVTRDVEGATFMDIKLAVLK